MLRNCNNETIGLGLDDRKHSDTERNISIIYRPLLPSETDDPPRMPGREYVTKSAEIGLIGVKS